MEAIKKQASKHREQAAGQQGRATASSFFSSCSSLLLARKMSSDEVGGKNDLPFLHMWELESLFSFPSSSGNKLACSGVFSAGGHVWKLAMKFGEVEAKEDKSYLSLFLVLVDAPPPSFRIEVGLESLIIHENNSRCSRRKVTDRFLQSKSEECDPYLLSLITLKCPFSGFLVVEIIDIVIHFKEDASLSRTLKNSFGAYTWRIDGFSKLAKRSYTSDPFLYNDHLWYLKLYPKGEAREDGKISISLYLSLDVAALASSVKIHADYYIEWVDQTGGKNHWHRGTVVFDKESALWGWPNFLSLNKLHKPSKGLLVDDTCIIKVGFLKCDIPASGENGSSSRGPVVDMESES